MSGNAEQIEYWNGLAGETWVTAQARLDEMLDPLSTLAIEHANAGSGERVIDVGCGCGATAITMAKQGANVWGIDISAPMLAKARELGRGLDNLRFSETDAATQAFTDDYNLLFSRFGVMFFTDPVAAFANLRTALAPSGRLVFLCWQAARFNPWIAVAGKAIQPFLPPPDTAPDPRAPGPFAFAERNYVEEILGSAGFAGIECAPVSASLRVGGSLDDVLDFQSRIGPISRVLADLDDTARSSAIDAAREALAAYLTPDGVHLDAACWLVTAS